jgi:hypothetical protein
MARQLVEAVVGDALPCGIHYHEAAGVAGLQRCLGDQFRWDLDIEFV